MTANPFLPFDPMSRLEKLLDKLLRGMSDANFPFDDLRYVLTRLGFAERIVGSHHIYMRHGVPEQIVLQPRGKDAVPYQVRQVREVLVMHQLGGGR